MSRPFGLPIWPDVQLDYNPTPASPHDQDGFFTRLMDSSDDPNLAQLSWDGMRGQVHHRAGEPPTSSNFEETPVAADNDHGHDQTASSHMILKYPSQQQWSTSPTARTSQSHPRPFPHSKQAQSLPSARLPWPKVHKPPSSKISVDYRIYLAHFKVTVLQAFPLQLPFLWDLVIKSEPVRCAALALAAANLANLQGKQLDSSQGTWPAVPTYLSKATTFSEQTLQALESDASLFLDATLVTMLLIIYYELEAGSFSDASHALSILNITILSCPEDVLSLTEGHNHIRWWLHLRSLTASAQGPYTPLGPENPTETLVNDLELRVATASHIFDIVGMKGSRLWYRILVAKCFGTYGDSPVSTVKKVDDWWRVLEGNYVCDPPDDYEGPTRFLSEDELYGELRKLKMTVESCKPPSEFQPGFLEATPAQGIVPLRFSSHRQAMEVANYAFAQIIHTTISRRQGRTARGPGRGQ